MGDPISMAFISATFQTLFEKVLNTLSTYTHHEYRLLLGGDDQGVHQALEKLKDTLTRFRTMVRDDELKEFKNKETRDWHRSVRCAVNEADIILEDPLDEDSDDRHKKRVCNPFPTLFEFGVRDRNKFSERIASLLQKFESLEVQRLHLNFDVITLNRETMSDLSEVVFGRNDEKEQIVKLLLSNADTQSDNGLRIYAIIGMGGIGKTTLARLIYNDKRVEEKFESVIWVWVSQTFDVKKLMEKIIETHSKETLTFESLETTQNHLKEMLRGKRFLIVLDDVWNERQEEWDKLMSPLKSGASGSSILLTTRGANVASTARAHNQHKITPLSEEQCWNVFKESAFLEGNQETGMLEVVGKQIAKKCGGLPLAAKSLGGSLRLTREVRLWESTRDSDIWELPEPSDILPALKLSLDILDSHARDCFAFCCVFPKGHKMLKKDLIELWMANDFFPSHKILEPEDVGNRIFTELVMKSFFEISYEYHGTEKHYYIRSHVQMHDLMHDLAFSFGNKGFCWEKDQDVSKIPSGVLHLSWHPSTNIKFRTSPGTNILETLSKYLPSLRTWNLYNNSIQYKYLLSEINFRNLNCLRALSLSWTEIHNLPASIGKIKQLKYLSLSGRTVVTHLPESICNLTKLQTLTLEGMEDLTLLPEGISKLVHLRNLDLSKCSGLTHLPDGIAGLVNLRCLYLIGCHRLTHLPDCIGSLINLRRLTLKHHRIEQLPLGVKSVFNRDVNKETDCKLPNGIGQLVNLRNLDYFVVDEQIGRRITELQGMNQLSGELEIRGLEHVRDRGEAESVFLKNKTNLSSLELIWVDSQVSNSILDEAKAEGVLEALQPPRLTKKLVIKRYGGSVFPSWMGTLENLVRIELRDCIKCKRLPPLGQLPLLKFLVISGMGSLKCIGAEFYGSNNSSSVIFPSLEELKFDDVPNLKEWKELEMKKDQHTGPFPSLKRLEIRHCPALQSVPVMRTSIVEVRIFECQSLKSLSQNLQYLSTLKSLVVSKCDELELSSEDFQGIISLKFLRIWDLPKLTSLPRLPHLSTLETLIVVKCKNLIRLWPRDGNNLTAAAAALETLIITNCEQLELLPSDFQHLIKLRYIKLVNLPKLTTSLPELHHLHCVITIRIVNCKNLRVLPQGLHNLTSLKKLKIRGCHSELHSRCEKNTGEYWPSIKHIRTVNIREPWEETPPKTP